MYVFLSYFIFMSIINLMPSLENSYNINVMLGNYEETYLTTGTMDCLLILSHSNFCRIYFEE